MLPLAYKVEATMQSKSQDGSLNVVENGNILRSLQYNFAIGEKMKSSKELKFVKIKHPNILTQTKMITHFA